MINKLKFLLISLLFSVSVQAQVINPGGGGGGTTLTVGTINSQTKSTNGAVITGSSLVQQTAGATFPGLCIATGTANQLLGTDSGATANEYKAVTATAAGALTAATSITSTLGNITATSGDVVLSSGKISMATAASQLVPGATSFAIRNNANSQNNLSVSNAGAVTTAGAFTVTAGGATITSGDVLVSNGGVTVTQGDIAAQAAGNKLILGSSLIPSAITTLSGSAPSIYSNRAAGNSYGAYIATGNNATATGIDMYRTRSTTAIATAAIQSGDTLGQSRFYGSDGTNFIPAASISSTVDGTPGTNDMPGSLVFSNTLDGAAALTETWRIKNSGLMQANQSVSMITTTSVDGTDDKRMVLAPAGNTSDWFNGNRGASIELQGNDANAFGTMILKSGDNAGQIIMQPTASAGSVSIRNNGGGETWKFNNSNGALLGDGTNGGDVVLNKSGSSLSVQEATASTACMGVATPNGVTNVTVTTSCAVSGARIFYTRVGAITNMGVVSTTTNPAGTSFTFASSGATDTLASSVVYLIVKES